MRGQLRQAETTFRTGMDLARRSNTRKRRADPAEAMLAVVILEQGRRDEARRMATRFCSGGNEALRAMLVKAKLCRSGASGERGMNGAVSLH